ncbi:MAG: hypothetical protein V4662_19590 [Verrucomicrobiota bacterium]
MFKKILQSLSKSQQAKSQAPVVPAKPSGPMPIAPVAPSGTVTPKANVLERVVIGTPQKDYPTTSATPRSPEELCEVNAKMPKDQISNRLKLLYRRFNRSASSLDPKIRAEAEKMLNAIVLVREKHFGEL